MRSRVLAFSRSRFFGATFAPLAERGLSPRGESPREPFLGLLSVESLSRDHGRRKERANARTRERADGGVGR
jgi:hypothetical protein